MSVSSGDEYTEEELLRVCEDIGLPITPESVGILKRVIDEIIAEPVLESDGGPLDSSLFGSLSLSDSFHPTDRSDNCPQDNISSPIHRLCKRSLRSNCRSDCQTKEVPLDVPSSKENELMKRHNPAAYFLLNDAWRCLNSVYRTMATIEDLQVKLSSVGYARTGSKSCRANGASKFYGKDGNEDKENQGGDTYHHPFGQHHLCPKFFKPYIRFKESNEGVPRDSSEKFTHPDPSLRRVDQIVPGQLFYKHDPVKKFELYREEWARRPAPGEQKRLTLRWKVREYMLRQDLASFDPRRQIARYTAHPKEWSPKPYLD